MTFSFKRRSSLVISLVLLILGWALFESYAEEILCGDERSVIECAYRHPSVIYINEFQQYPILDSAIIQVSSNACKDLDFLTATLAVGVGFYPMHAHYSEEMTELIDNLLISDPECFMRSLVLMDGESRITIGEFLKKIEKDKSNFQSGGMAAILKFSTRPEYSSVFSDFK